MNICDILVVNPALSFLPVALQGANDATELAHSIIDPNHLSLAYQSLHVKGCLVPCQTILQNRLHFTWCCRADKDGSWFSLPAEIRHFYNTGIAGNAETQELLRLDSCRVRIQFVTNLTPNRKAGAQLSSPMRSPVRQPSHLPSGLGSPLHFRCTIDNIFGHFSPQGVSAVITQQDASSWAESSQRKGSSSYQHARMGVVLLLYFFVCNTTVLDG